MSSSLVVRLASAESELQEIFTFRYRVYVQEQGRFQRYADHEAKTIREPLDYHSRIFGAWVGGTLVGTVRSTFCRDGGAHEYSRLYGLHDAGDFHPMATSFSTKLIVADNHRGNLVVMRLCKATFLDGLANGILFNYIDCNPSRPRIIELFEAFGYIRAGEIVHPEYGVAIKLVMCLSDSARFLSRRSPFSDYVREVFSPQAVELLNSGLLTKKAVLSTAT